MKQANSVDLLETIVNTLLQVSDRVVEVSNDYILTRIWDRADSSLKLPVDYFLGKKIPEIRNDFIFSQCQERIIECFNTGKNSCIEYTTYNNNSPQTYCVRIINCHTDDNFIFVTVEHLTNRTDINIIEDKWKLALDASGDGVWDSNLETGKMFFSEKWYEIFGYSPDEITSGEDWRSKIHPEDLDEINLKSQKYLAGETPIYSAEFRYKCKDGGYKWILSSGVIIARTPDGKPLRYIGTHKDIHARKLAEEKHIETAELLSTLINSLNDGVLVTDENGVIVLFNQKYADLNKNYLDPERLKGLNIRESLRLRKIFYKDPEYFISRTQELLNNKQMSLNNDFELSIDIDRILRMDYIPMMVENKYKGEIWKFTDVTEQKNIDSRFEKQRVFYEQILDNLAFDMAVFDDNYRYIYLNQNSIKDEELRKWMIGKTDEEYIRYRNKPMEIAEKRTELLKKAVNEKRIIEFEEKLKTKDENYDYILRRIYPVYNKSGDMEFIIGYGIKITELVLVREALKSSIDTFTNAFENSGYGMALIAPGGDWLDVNKALCDISGYKKDELLKIKYRDITYIDDVELDADLIRGLYAKEIDTYTVEKRYVTKQKSIILVSLNVSIVWNKDGTPKFFIAQIIDITKKKELEIIVVRKNADLEATRLNLVNKITQLEELNRIIAHNLRGPVNNIKMLVSVLKDKIMPGESVGNRISYSDTFTTNETLEFIDNSTISLSNSLETLMEITQIQLNKQIPFDNCDLSQIIDEITKQLHGTIFEKMAVINKNFEVKEISYPKVYLESICYNFLSNALKYSRKEVAPEINISSKMVNGRLQLTFKDNGLGIDMAKYGKKIFKLNQVFHIGYDSKGVGLYITKTQVESLGGTIELKSKVNEGSEFIITI